MGTWGTGNFENDSALDYVGEVAEEMERRIDDIIADENRRALDEEGEPMVGITLDVLEDRIYPEREAWRGNVMPSREPRWMYAYYEVLAEVECNLQENEGLNVMFVPLVPEDAEPLAA